jgi:hypothetical protein
LYCIWYAFSFVYSCCLRFSFPGSKLPMPAPASRDQPWWSYDIGLIHFVGMSTEHDYSVGSPQHRWIEADLAGVNRSLTPWVVFSGHRPMYVDSHFCCGWGVSDDACDGQCTAYSDVSVMQMLQTHVEPLLFQYQVNLAFAGHFHNVQRQSAVYQGRVVQRSRQEVRHDFRGLLTSRGRNRGSNIRKSRSRYSLVRKQGSSEGGTGRGDSEAIAEVGEEKVDEGEGEGEEKNEGVLVHVQDEPQGTVWMVVGSAGNGPSLSNEQYPWSEASWDHLYGYATVSAANATHLYWEFVDSATDAVVDRVLLTRKESGGGDAPWQVLQGPCDGSSTSTDPYSSDGQALVLLLGLGLVVVGALVSLLQRKQASSAMQVLREQGLGLGHAPPVEGGGGGDGWNLHRGEGASLGGSSQHTLLFDH